MHNQPPVAVQIVVQNGERFLRHCLRAVAAQTYPNLEVLVFDNASTDTTRDIIEKEFPQFALHRNDTNLGMWPGQEAALRLTSAPYVLALSVDVMLDPNFITRCVETFESDASIGAIQGKIYQYDITELTHQGSTALQKNVIDTCGFGIYSRPRRPQYRSWHVGCGCVLQPL